MLGEGQKNQNFLKKYLCIENFMLQFYDVQHSRH